MPRYFFDIDDGQEAPDAAGSDWPDMLAVRRRAMTLAADRAGSDEALATGGSAIVVTVRDEADATVATVRVVTQIEPLHP